VGAQPAPSAARRPCSATDATEICKADLSRDLGSPSFLVRPGEVCLLGAADCSLKVTRGCWEHSWESPRAAVGQPQGSRGPSRAAQDARFTKNDTGGEVWPVKTAIGIGRTAVQGNLAGSARRNPGTAAAPHGPPGSPSSRRRFLPALGQPHLQLEIP